MENVWEALTKPEIIKKYFPVPTLKPTGSKTGLLKPSLRAESGYRYDGKAEALRFQRILLYKEPDFPQAQIIDIPDEPGFESNKQKGRKMILPLYFQF